MMISRWVLVLALVVAAAPNARALNSNGLKLMPSTALLAGSGSDASGLTTGQKVGYVAVGTLGTVAAALMPILPAAWASLGGCPGWSACTNAPSALLYLFGLALLEPIMLKWTASLFGIERTWSSTFAAIGLTIGIVTAAALVVVPLFLLFGSDHQTEGNLMAVTLVEVGGIAGLITLPSILMLTDPFHLSPSNDQSQASVVNPTSLARPLATATAPGRQSTLGVPLFAGSF